MEPGYFAFVISGLFFLLLQAHESTKKWEKASQVEVEIDNNDAVMVTIKGNKGYCLYNENNSEHNWKIMNVVCRQRHLGPPKEIRGGHAFLRPKPFDYCNYLEYNDKKGRNRGQIQFENKTYYDFRCNGNETSLSECLYQRECHIFEHGFIAILEAKCLSANPKDFKIYLMRDNRYGNLREGTIVTYVNGSWGPICTRYQNLSSFACPLVERDLVPKTPNETHNNVQRSYAHPVVFVNKCDGNEANLSLCDVWTTRTARCNVSSYAYVQCKKVYNNRRDTGGRGLSYEQLLGIMAIIPCLILCTSSICIKKASRVRKGLRYADDDDDSEILDPNMSVDEARLRVVRKFF